MVRKVFPIISLIVISGFALMFFFDTKSIDDEILQDTFSIDATYYENENYVEIIFEDTTQKTHSAILEILGMETTFQKTFEGSTFTERIEFFSEPKYGWKIHPVTILVEHEELGKIGLKTEIHSQNEPTPPVIFTTS